MNMVMRAVGLLVLLIGAAVTWRGTQLGYINYRMPAAGFFPFWDGLLLITAGAFLLFGKLAPMHLPKDIDLKKQLVAIALVAGYLVVMSILGTVLATVIYFFVTLYVLGRHKWSVVILSAGLSLLIIYAAFEMWLHIPLARGIFEHY